MSKVTKWSILYYGERRGREDGNGRHLKTDKGTTKGIHQALVFSPFACS
jgi:hypothetical protein